MNKRILNELNNKIPEKLEELDLYNKFYFAQLDYHIIPNEIGIINKLTNEIELKLIIPQYYPFKPPAVYIESNNANNNANNNYNMWLSRILYKPFNKKMSNLQTEDIFLAWIFSVIRRPKLAYIWGNIPTMNTCLCCNSITCSDKWIPSNMLTSILVEYITHNDLRVNCKPLMNRYISSIFKNDRWVIPDDILYKISEHCLE